MSLSPPVADQPNLSFEGKQISDLSDADLAAVFERLPPYDRLIVSEVCRRWHALSRKDWLDIAHLDFGPIPGKHIAAIVRQCPNLRAVFARKKSFELDELVGLAKSSQLSTVKLYDCNAAVQSDANQFVVSDAFAKIFSENLQHASWSELVYHDARMDDRAVLSSNARSRWYLSASYLPANLTHLQLTGLYMSSGRRLFAYPFLVGLERLQNLQCFVLHVTRGPADDDLIGGCLYHNANEIFDRLCALKSLRELCIGPAYPTTGWRSARLRFDRISASLPKLEVLFLNDIDVEDFKEDCVGLITDSALRILVLSGPIRRRSAAAEPIDLPARKRLPHGLGSDPLPLLHVFVGRCASEHLHFAQSSSDAAIIYPIDQPMPAFLEREGIAPIFEGCWVAEKIKETAKNGGKLWDYERYDRS